MESNNNNNNRFKSLLKFLVEKTEAIILETN